MLRSQVRFLLAPPTGLFVSKPFSSSQPPDSRPFGASKPRLGHQRDRAVARIHPPFQLQARRGALEGALGAPGALRIALANPNRGLRSTGRKELARCPDVERPLAGGGRGGRHRRKLHGRFDNLVYDHLLVLRIALEDQEVDGNHCEAKQEAGLGEGLDPGEPPGDPGELGEPAWVSWRPTLSGCAGSLQSAWRES